MLYEVITILPLRTMNRKERKRSLVALVLFAVFFSVTGYFPSYELFMDDLRDYRFYATDSYNFV